MLVRHLNNLISLVFADNKSCLAGVRSRSWSCSTWSHYQESWKISCGQSLWTFFWPTFQCTLVLISILLKASKFHAKYVTQKIYIVQLRPRKKRQNFRNETKLLKQSMRLSTSRRKLSMAPDTLLLRCDWLAIVFHPVNNLTEPFNFQVYDVFLPFHQICDNNNSSADSQWLVFARCLDNDMEFRWNIFF